jgi:hypothetical protein
MSLPPGVTRKSIATYALEKVPLRSHGARITRWAPERGTCYKKSFARHHSIAAKVKTRRFWSATVKNR